MYILSFGMKVGKRQVFSAEMCRLLFLHEKNKGEKGKGEGTASPLRYSHTHLIQFFGHHGIHDLSHNLCLF